VGPAITYVDEKPADPIHLFIFSGADGEFTLYEDEGRNYNYEKGEFSTITFSYDDSTRTLRIGERQGAFEGMIEQRTFLFTLVDGEQTGPLNFDRAPRHSVQYKGSSIELQL
jgi:alpha-D-xyloside xylohydrolase